jgi:hypothetical protein
MDLLGDNQRIAISLADFPVTTQILEEVAKNPIGDSGRLTLELPIARQFSLILKPA